MRFKYLHDHHFSSTAYNTLFFSLMFVYIHTDILYYDLAIINTTKPLN